MIKLCTLQHSNDFFNFFWKNHLQFILAQNCKWMSRRIITFNLLRFFFHYSKKGKNWKLIWNIPRSYIVVKSQWAKRCQCSTLSNNWAHEVWPWRVKGFHRSLFLNYGAKHEVDNRDKREGDATAGELGREAGVHPDLCGVRCRPR